MEKKTYSRLIDPPCRSLHNHQADKKGFKIRNNSVISVKICILHQKRQEARRYWWTHRRWSECWI